MINAWVKKIVGNADVPPGDLILNDKNFRLHPASQKQALQGVISDIGFLRSVTVNKRTGRVIDGALRLTLALETGQPTIPVEYVDLTEEEEAEALATIDPIAALAETDKPMLEALLRQIQSPDSAVQKMLADLAAKHGLLQTAALAQDQSGQIKEQYQVLVTCEAEEQQAELLERLTQEGYECRSLIS
jgi:hypothetical protein